MASTIEELTINYEEEGVHVVKELDKAVLTKGTWTTIVYKFQQWERAKEDYGPVKYTIRRYRKMQGEYRQQSKFNISNDEQAQKIIDVLTGWLSGKTEDA